jgi:hypothetical protein
MVREINGARDKRYMNVTVRAIKEAFMGKELLAAVLGG